MGTMQRSEDNLRDTAFSSHQGVLGIEQGSSETISFTTELSYLRDPHCFVFFSLAEAHTIAGWFHSKILLPQLPKC